jgi:hypothetical protein
VVPGVGYSGRFFFSSFSDFKRMGAYSTVQVHRTFAIRKIMDRLFEAPNEQIAEILFELYGQYQLNYFRIIPDEVELDIPFWDGGFVTYTREENE